MNQYASIITMGALVVAALAYLDGSWRRGNVEATKDLLEIARQERDILQDRADRLEGELAEQRERHQVQVAEAQTSIARLEGTVEQQRTEIESLRQLVMMEAVPPALVKAMETVGEKVASTIVKQLKP